jgi:hypothetical protein
MLVIQKPKYGKNGFKKNAISALKNEEMICVANFFYLTTMKNQIIFCINRSNSFKDYKLKCNM